MGCVLIRKTGRIHFVVCIALKFICAEKPSICVCISTSSLYRTMVPTINDGRCIERCQPQSPQSLNALLAPLTALHAPLLVLSGSSLSAPLLDSPCFLDLLNFDRVECRRCSSAASFSSSSFSADLLLSAGHSKSCEQLPPKRRMRSVATTVRFCGSRT